MKTLEGKVALVLGAAGKDNMGQVIARRFADEGAQIAVAGRNREELDRLAESIGGAAFTCDITRKNDLQAMVDGVVARFGRLDIAVNATGWGKGAPFADLSEEDLDQMIAIQFKGPYQLLQMLSQVMGEGGSVIQISSATSRLMVPDYAAYQGTKAGVDQLIRVFANDFGPKGIRANTISPGFTETPMTADAFAIPGLADAFVAKYPLGRVGTSDDIAAAAVWLASDECFMTGENLQVNGGLSLRGNPSGAEIGAAIEKASGG
ncbi:MAG TPA: SDR family oxidoreductase [Sphingomonas sp.]|nr:SDR family oxidoreductase [Sphingomonas sp.]